MKKPKKSKPKKLTPKRERPYRSSTSRQTIANHLKHAETYNYATLINKEAVDVLKLALSTFNDGGTSAADLDEELSAIDDVLERAGLNPERGAVFALEKLARRCGRLERKLRRRK